MSDPQVTAPPDFHHVSLKVSKVSHMEMARNEHQLIKAIVDAKLSPKDALSLVLLLVVQLVEWKEGMGDIKFSLEGDFT